MIPDKKSDTLVIIGNGKWEDKEFLDAPFSTLFGMDVWAIGGGVYSDVMITKKYYDKKTYPVDYLFEIHTKHTRSKDYLDWLEKNQTKKIMQEESEELNAISYPLDRVIKHFDSRYFMCSFAYMLALGILMEYKYIELYGVNMAFLDDYTQKYNCDYWLGRVQEKGIKLKISSYSDLLTMPKLYGYEADNTLAVHVRNSMTYKVKAIFTSLEEGDCEKAAELCQTYFRDSHVFMKEIYDRHGLDVKKGLYIEGDD